MTYVVTSATDPEGHSTDDKRLGLDQVRSHLRYIGDSHGWQRPVYRRNYRDTGRYLTINRAYPFPRPKRWFYLDERKVYVAYSAGD